MTLSDLIDIANTGGIVGLLVVIVIALLTERVIPKTRYDRDLARERRRTAFWQRTAWVALGLAKANAPDVPNFDFEPVTDMETEP